jgi:hypothetical protein
VDGSVFPPTFPSEIPTVTGPSSSAEEGPRQGPWRCWNRLEWGDKGTRCRCTHIECGHLHFIIHL